MTAPSFVESTPNMNPHRRAPGLSELPPPPSGRTGWPWTEEAAPLLPVTSDGRPWPRITIVTPSYNQAAFLEETIRSVLLQGYPDLEYMIIDGGSTDGSTDIIGRYAPWLAYWVSEPDAGQSDALNKGFSRATGELVNWLNSDDVLLPGGLARLAECLMEHPAAVLAYGDLDFLDPQSTRSGTWHTKPSCTTEDLILLGCLVPQPSVLFRRSILNSAGGIDSKLHYIMDYDLWIRLSLYGELLNSSATIASFRRHDTSKSIVDGPKFYNEIIDRLPSWISLSQSLSDDLLAEALRRNRIGAALEYLDKEDESAVADHFSLALSDRVWPFGGVEALGNYVLYHRTLSGCNAIESSERIETLSDALNWVKPKTMGRRLRHQILRTYHLSRHLPVVFYERGRTVPAEYRYHWLQAVRLDPRLLINRGVWASIGKSLVRGKN